MAKRPASIRRHSKAGAAATEYILILGLVVLPIALAVLAWAPRMIKFYGSRFVHMMNLPFP